MLFKPTLRMLGFVFTLTTLLLHFWAQPQLSKAQPGYDCPESKQKPTNVRINIRTGASDGVQVGEMFEVKVEAQDIRIDNNPLSISSAPVDFIFPSAKVQVVSEATFGINFDGGVYASTPEEANIEGNLNVTANSLRTSPTSNPAYFEVFAITMIAVDAGEVTLSTKPTSLNDEINVYGDSAEQENFTEFCTITFEIHPATATPTGDPTSTPSPTLTETDVPTGSPSATGEASTPTETKASPTEKPTDTPTFTKTYTPTPLPPIELLTPENQAMFSHKDEILLSWKHFNGIEQYTIKFKNVGNSKKDPRLLEANQHCNLSSLICEYRIDATNKLGKGHWKWRVIGKAGGQSTRSPKWELHLIKMKLLFPPSNISVSNPFPTFTWKALSPHPSGKEWQYFWRLQSANSDEGGLWDSRDWINEAKYNLHDEQGVLLSAGSYEWYVAARLAGTDQPIFASKRFRLDISFGIGIDITKPPSKPDRIPLP